MNRKLIRPNFGDIKEQMGRVDRRNKGAKRYNPSPQKSMAGSESPWKNKAPIACSGRSVRSHP